MSGSAAKKPRREADLSARFTPAERQRVERATAKSGRRLSEFIRDAVLSSADRVLAEDPVAVLEEFIGAIELPGEFGRRADDLYAELLLEKHGPDARRTRRP